MCICTLNTMQQLRCCPTFIWPNLPACRKLAPTHFYSRALRGRTPLHTTQQRQRLCDFNGSFLKLPDISNVPFATALHPDSTRTLTVQVNGDADIEAWEAAPETTELQEIPGLEGLDLSFLTMRGVFGAGNYLGVLEVTAVHARFRSYCCLLSASCVAALVWPIYCGPVLYCD